jgi:hypothetical protein
MGFMVRACTSILDGISVGNGLKLFPTNQNEELASLSTPQNVIGFRLRYLNRKTLIYRFDHFRFE